MFASRPFRPSCQLLLVGYLVLALLVVQGLRVHFHTFADHESLHGHDHPVELHIDGMPSDSGHDDDVSEVGPAKLAVLKIKTEHTDGLALAFATALLLFIVALSGRVSMRSARQTPPAPGGDVRTPPLRAPPL